MPLVLDGEIGDAAPRIELTAPRLADLAALDDAGFRALFTASPIKRVGRDRFVRNVLIALGNSGRRDLAPVAERLIADASPLVRAMAAWALARLAPDRHAAMAEAALAGEDDPAVRAEWTREERMREERTREERTGTLA